MICFSEPYSEQVAPESTSLLQFKLEHPTAAGTCSDGFTDVMMHVGEEGYGFVLRPVPEHLPMYGMQAASLLCAPSCIGASRLRALISQAIGSMQGSA